jgi:hypothetical protein
VTLPTNKIPFPTKPVLLGAFGGMILTVAIGFNWFGIPGLGWMTSNSAKVMANDAVVERLVPICVAQAKGASEAQSLTELMALTSTYRQAEHVRNAGWATLGDADTPDRKLSDLCAKALMAAKAT